MRFGSLFDRASRQSRRATRRAERRRTEREAAAANRLHAFQTLEDRIALTINIDTLPDIARECAVMLQIADGAEKALARVGQSLRGKPAETAYLLACDVAAIDGNANWQEGRILGQLREVLGLGQLEAAALERATRARYAAG